jgi:E3 ubiquitin-protein ligase ZNF598
MCKQENDQLIVDHVGDKRLFEEYPLWGNELGSNFVYRDDVGMFFPKEYYESEIIQLFNYHCGICNSYQGLNTENQVAMEDKRTSNNQRNDKNTSSLPLAGLQEHLRRKHQRTLCELCVENKRDFVALLPRFNPNQLKNHMAKGDSLETGFRGHPMCEFCKPKRFYDITHLHIHLQKDHYKCFVCEKQGLFDQYYRDYDALEKHFDRKHFLCQDPQCRAAHFVVFENEIDLRAHEIDVHGRSSTGSTKIKLEFRVRREGYSGAGYENQTVPTDDDFQFGVDGEAFVPEGLPQSSQGINEETSHPLHYQRTSELRAQAATIRAALQINSEDEAFPSLGSSNTSDSIRMGWADPQLRERLTRSGITADSPEQFPALPSAPKVSKKVQISKLRPNNSISSRPNSVSMTASNGNNSGNWASQAARTPAQGTQRTMNSTRPTSANTGIDMKSQNFPSLAAPRQVRSSYPTQSVNYGSQQVKNFTSDTLDFPSLSAKTPAPVRPTTNSQSAAKKQIVKNQQIPTQNDFPSLPTNNGKAKKAYPVNRMAKTFNNGNSLPELNNHNFPLAASIGKAAPRIVEDHKLPTENNLVSFPALAISVNTQIGAVTIQDMKDSLGPIKYKKLKQLTKDFAEEKINPFNYIDDSAILFDNGYADNDFWTFIPSLLRSCPNELRATEALSYIETWKTSIQASETSQAGKKGHGSSSSISSESNSASASGVWSQGFPKSNSQQSNNIQSQQSARNADGVNQNTKKKNKKQVQDLRALAYGR